MTNYRIIIGEVILRDKETGELLNEGASFPLTHSNVIVDTKDVSSKELTKYLVNDLGIEKYRLQKMEESPIYLEYELN